MEEAVVAGICRTGEDGQVPRPMFGPVPFWKWVEGDHDPGIGCPQASRGPPRISPQPLQLLAEGKEE